MVDVSPAKQQIICSRSFGRYVTELNELEEAVSAYMSRAAEKLRRQNSVAATAYVYICTNSHKESEPQYKEVAAYAYIDGENCSLWGLLAAAYGVHGLYN